MALVKIWCAGGPHPCGLHTATLPKRTMWMMKGLSSGDT